MNRTVRHVAAVFFALAGRHRRRGRLRVGRTLGSADPHRQHARAHRAARVHGARPSARRRDLRRADQQEERSAGPPGRVDRQGRPVEARARAHAVRAAHHGRQGRPADGAVRDRRDPFRDGRRATLQQDPHPPHLRHSEPRQVRRALSDVVAGADPAATFPNTLLDALAATPKPPKTIAIVTSKFPSVHFMSLGAREVAKKRGPAGGRVPGMGLRQPRFRRHRGAREGCEPRFRVGRRDRARGQPVARRDEEDRLHAAAALLHVPGARPDGAGARGQECAGGHDLRGESALTSTIRVRPSS